ncbi:hypothetical protein [Rhodoferax sp.]|uniref:hypothetical protein n=1 Tax=Rhodoferax sp. TaxID=50421 RepID=UPI0008D20429|nr:hypothetical protein [Rhodoferax sp.]OGB38873.1 MAG: hypothetical protein A2461_08240 [Burkholderiales bacterium RIFOXYC2_FULL_59_8]OGB53625.1 MAG: hypothetical protein A2503_08340 [Burkholderiales bacterium RIFOXYD12_FULL_59_19]OGB79252.1 MAG: hypothetical protein A2496_18710 [Burkholderiales bacterium RIFOXYC12_FULL_60_6]OGB84843.1 MAG: hypothetical protein A2535_03965 [Burkholderiales bacterium RIFOXYD2_FULL_59_8]MDO8318854.1 hypothetical protein [Rhodoferax sp.]
MRPIYTVLPLLLACGLAWSQTAPAAAAPNATVQPDSPGKVQPRVEHIHVEDAGASIDEVRVGGATQSITVQPKGGMPAYQVAPKTGERSWKVLGF